MFSKLFGDFRNFQIFIISGILKRYVSIRHSQQKLLERPTKMTLSLKENVLKANELVDLSHGTQFHPKGAET